ncbi:MAG: glycerol-3-phosphate dehydrogenase [Candidatus Promineifilaceae bacterium]|jgi:glycerol-3-phosphate dehydrogenase
MSDMRRHFFALNKPIQDTNFMNRNELIQYYKNNPAISVLIIGGGINGLGVFRDLALQGVDVLLVDRADFCSGTSAASSRMVHGGIRYLENGEFRLVKEAVQERNRLIKNAPHYVKPLPTTIPIFSRFSGMLNAPMKFVGMLTKPAERGAFIIKMGLMLYDSYTGAQDGVPKHEFWNKRQSLKHFPDLNPDIMHTATYYDGSMRDAERIAIEVMLDGEKINTDARALNYVSASAAERNCVTLTDHESREIFTIEPKLVINAAGPWIDFVNQALGQTSDFIGGTKGSHIVVDNPELLEATKGREIFFENEDGRIVLIYPLAGRVIVGTTDVYIENPDDAICTEDEIDYFIEFTQIVFPKIQIKREQIVYTFSGVRPLPSTKANSTGQISRDHHNEVVEPGELFDFPIFNLVGGKWTSFRAFAEQVTDATLDRLGENRVDSTRHRPIGGGVDYPQTESDQERWVGQLATETETGSDRIATLFDRYGTGAREIALFCADGDDRPLEYKSDFSEREIIWIICTEKVVHINDLLQRRSLLAMTGQVSVGLLKELAQIIGRECGWDEARQAVEVDKAKDELVGRHRAQIG